MNVRAPRLRDPDTGQEFDLETGAAGPAPRPRCVKHPRRECAADCEYWAAGYACRLLEPPSLVTDGL